jgi:nucleotide-binding universal stress UspA family protein
LLERPDAFNETRPSARGFAQVNEPGVPMSKPIVVGYDTTSSDHAPVSFSVAAARCIDAPLIIVCVYATAAAGDRLGAGQVNEDLVADASAALEEVTHELEADGIRVQYRALEEENAARALHETAKVEQAGLLVVGSTRRRAGGRVLPGSLVERLMHGAPRPIAVVPSGWEAGMRFKTIGAAYIDSEEGRDALRGAYALARRAGATLRVLTAVRASFAMYGETEGLIGGQHGQDFDALEGELRAQTETDQRAAIAALGDDVAVETGAVVADPAGALVRASEHLDLLVCGSRGYGPLRAVLLGSVSRRVATAARCPVLVLPRGAEFSLDALLAPALGAAAAG